MSVSRYAPNSRYSARGEGLHAVPADVEVVADTLRTLDLSANELQALSLPVVLPVLEELLLADNLLDAPTMQRLRPALPITLRILDLTANRLVAFPPLLLRLPQLTVLRVARQQLRALPSALSALASLEELDASYNSLGAALQLDAPGLPRLRRLLLNGNCLTTVCAVTLTLTPTLTLTLTLTLKLTTVYAAGSGQGGRPGWVSSTPPPPLTPPLHASS